MNRMLTTQDISWFLDLHGRGQLDLDPPYQRRSVWSLRDRRFFIDTILNNYPAPPVFLHKTMDEHGHSTYHVVDGKQRLQTIIAFVQDKITIPDDFSNVYLQKKRWKDLGRENRVAYWNYELIVEMIPDVSDAQIRSTFDRINRNSRRLTAQEMRHAKYDGWFIEFVEHEAEKKEEWRDLGIVTTARMKRMRDVQFISELCAVVLKNRILGFDQDALDDIYADYDDISELSGFVEDDFVCEVGRIKKNITDMIKEKPQLRSPLKAQSNFYSLWSFLHLEQKCHSEIREFVSRYHSFMESVQKMESSELSDESSLDGSPALKTAGDYASSARGASTDLAPRLRRHKALVLGIQHK